MIDEQGFSLDDDEMIDINLRSIDETVRRAVVLVSLVRRAAMEEANPSDGENEAFERETDRFELYSWSWKELASARTEEERDVLHTPAGELSQQQTDQCLEASFPANALCWTLGVVDELGPSDAQNVELDPLLAWSPQPWDDLDRLVKKSSLRDEVVIAQERERWELWFWRATLEEGDLEPDEDMRELVANVAVAASEAGLISERDEDFDVNGQPFRQVEAELRSVLAERAEAYLLALNWVCGFGDSWDDVPLYPD